MRGSDIDGAVDYNLNLRLLRRIARLAAPYWYRRGALPAWAGLCLTLLYGVTLSTVILQSASWLKDATDALLAHNWPEFQAALIVYLLLYGAHHLLPQAHVVLTAIIQASWSRWLTNRVIAQYMACRVYYDISLQANLDNPDQRIAENIAPFTANLLQLFGWVVGVCARLAAVFAVLATLDPRFLKIVPFVAVCQVAAAYLTIEPSVRRQVLTQVAEGNLRSKLVHLRDHAEAVAFYRAEAIEHQRINQLADHATQRQFIYDRFEALLEITVSALFHIVWLVLPYALLGDLVAAGAISYGTLAQATAMTLVMQNVVETLTLIVSQTGNLGMQASRLGPLQERLDAISVQPSASSRIIQRRGGDQLVLSEVSVQTPGDEQQLVQHLDLVLDKGDRLLIVGPTGIGKSSLLRVMAGLWERGEGQLVLPEDDSMLFIPQRSYFTSGDLRTQLLYPHVAGADDEALRRVLHAVHLPHLLVSRDGLDARCDWAQTLSPGEQQRIAFARVLLCRPDFVFLDEATSAVDPNTEGHLYGLLVQLGCAVVSVGHRLAIARHHTHVLELAPGRRWGLMKADEFCAGLAHEMLQ